MLNFIRNSQELQHKLSWRCRNSSVQGNLNKSGVFPANDKENADFPPTFSLKLEESNLANVYNHVDPSALNPLFYTSPATKVKA